MRYLHGSTSLSSPSSCRFKKNIGGKEFKYCGEKSSGVFIEEIVYLGLQEIGYNPHKKQCAVIEDEYGDIYVVFLMDFADDSPGESTLVFESSDLTLEEKVSAIADFVGDNEATTIYFDIKDGILSIDTPEDEPTEITLSSLKPEQMVSGAKKIADKFKKNSLVLSLSVFLFVFPAFTIPFLDSAINNSHETSIATLDKQLKISKSEVTKQQLKLGLGSKKFQQMRDEEDFFDSKDVWVKLKKISFRAELKPRK